MDDLERMEFNILDKYEFEGRSMLLYLTSRRPQRRP